MTISRRSPHLVLLALSIAALCSGCADGGAPGGGDVGEATGDEGDDADRARVIALDPYITQPTAALLGVEVVGRATPPFDSPILTFLPEDELATLESAQDVGWVEYDIETIATLDADAAVTTDQFVAGDEGLVELLEQVVEVRRVANGLDYHQDWRGAVREVAAALGDEVGVVDDRIATLDDRIADLREDIEAAGWTASLLNVRAQDDVRLYVGSCGTSVLDDLGFGRPERQPEAGEDEIAIDLSFERLPDADADVLFTFLGSTGTDPSTFDQATTGLEDDPLYRSLGAVSEGRAHVVDADHWFGCGSLQAAEAIVDDVERFASGW